ncbi:hypothetical protein SSX86_020600 [Deinandra increscens subsp. villosa]|uniref:Uncharacterized protein n=1 Tax=Deinandra increscens subsp. villosa TaxID=3103831 RepID=A0AAP0GSD4_9ASTR
MSRCFPYPPPGYCRSGATYEALIESIKLQKVTDKTKAELKKEKKAKKEKKEKRHKEKRNREDGIKSQKNTNGDSCKVLQKTTDCIEAQIKKTKAVAEVFEKSDLTEEHGQSIGLHQPSYSSDSTQNSNKRKRDDVHSFTDGSTVHGKGKPIKILLLKKHKGSDSNNFSADASSIARPSAPPSNLDRSVISSIRNNGVPVTTVGETRIQKKSNPGDPNMRHIGRIQSSASSVKPIHSSGLKKGDAEVLHSLRPHQPISSFGRQTYPPIHSENEFPSSSGASRHVGEQKLHSGRQQQLAPSHHVTPNPISNKTSISSVVGKRSNHEIADSGKDGLPSIKKQKEDPQKVRPTRTEKKMLKKHAKYEKLVGNWFPPVSQAQVPGDEDWLSGSKTSSSSVSMGEVETCRQLVAPWQPCARFLAEAGIHAMPYTVPF